MTHDHPDTLAQHDHEGHGVSGGRVALLKPVVLAGLGVYFTYLIVSGDLSNYIHLRFAALTYLSSIVFFGLAAVSFHELMRLRRGHQTHQHVSWAAVAFLGVPLVFGSLLPSQPLGAAAADGSMAANLAARGRVQELAADTRDWNVLDWLQAIQTSGDAQSLNGREADVLGFVHVGEAFPDDHFMVARFLLSCCVADAIFLGLPVHVPEGFSVTQDQWVRVRGTVEIREWMGEAMPVITATGIDDTASRPARPYLYP